MTPSPIPNLIPGLIPNGAPFVRPGVSGYFPRPQGNTPLEHAILTRARGSVSAGTYGPPQITTDLASLTGAVESAFVTIPRDALPKIERAPRDTYSRRFHFAGGHEPLGTSAAITADQARKKAAAWVSVAAVLEAEEKAAADAAKAKAKADAARRKRLDELAGEYFEAPYDELGARKARVIEDTYKLEQQLAAADDSCGCN